MPEQCVCIGEVRSFSHEKALHWIEIINRAFADAAERFGASFDMETKEVLRAYHVPDNAPVVSRFQRACAAIGLPGTLRATFGGSDNHNYLKAGISGIVISCGMQRVYSTEEHISIQQLMKGAAFVAQLIQ